MALALIALGSNVGDRLRSLELAVEKLHGLAQCEVVTVSGWRETVPAGGTAGQFSYLNGCVLMRCALDPEALLADLQCIENELGRTREEHWGPRTIDLDLLLYDDLRYSSLTLTIPHPRMTWRRFVIEPAAEIAPLMCHPVVGWTMSQLRDHLAQSPFYLAIAGPIAAGKSTLARAMVDRHKGLLIQEQFSSQQLKEFYEDPAGQAWTTELEFLSRRRADLAVERDVWNDRNRPIISDYWFDQSLAFARVWLPQEKQSAYFERWQQLRKQVVQPRLIVMMDMPTDELLERIHKRARPGEEMLNVARLDALRDSFQQQLQEPDIGPVMRLSIEENANWESELSAAIVAMA